MSNPTTEAKVCFACNGTGIIKGSIPAMDRPCVCRDEKPPSAIDQLARIAKHWPPRSSGIPTLTQAQAAELLSALQQPHEPREQPPPPMSQRQLDFLLAVAKTASQEGLSLAQFQWGVKLYFDTLEYLTPSPTKEEKHE